MIDELEELKERLIKTIDTGTLNLLDSDFELILECINVVQTSFKVGIDKGIIKIKQKPLN